MLPSERCLVPPLVSTYDTSFPRTSGTSNLAEVRERECDKLFCLVGKKWIHRRSIIRLVLPITISGGKGGGLIFPRKRKKGGVILIFFNKRYVKRCEIQVRSAEKAKKWQIRRDEKRRKVLKRY